MQTRLMSLVESWTNIVVGFGIALLDVIDRIITLRTNHGEIVFTPFMGVGSEVYAAVLQGRLGIGAELKASYYRQSIKNCQFAADGRNHFANNDELALIQCE